MDIGDVGGLIAALGAIGGLFFAGQQLRLLRQQQAEEREVEKGGVAVMWRTLNVPTVGDVDGTTTSTYEFTAYNPGKLPVREVDARVSLPVEAQRRHFDGSMEATTKELVLDTPVIAGGQSRKWRRTLRIPFDGRTQMREIQVSISFLDLKGKKHTNHWGRGAGLAAERRTH